MSKLSQLVVFLLEEQRYALLLDSVERIVRAVEVTPLPNAPEIVLGVINVEGRILPVLNLRARLGLADKKITSAHLFLLARTARRPVILVIDEALGMVERPTAEIAGAAGIVPGLEQIQGVVKIEDGLALIYDLEKFLSLEEAAELDEAMNGEAARAN